MIKGFKILERDDVANDLLAYHKKGAIVGVYLGFPTLHNHYTMSLPGVTDITGFPACFTKEQLIITESGNKPISEIKIGEKGVDATHLDYFDILSKTVDIAGIIKGGENTRILISTGSQVYEYKTKKVESKGRTYEGVAVDGKAMGSMYAGKIDIISNDKGAGVNTKGDLVSIDDITITASGDITTGKVESTRKVAYKTTKKVKTT